MSRSGRGFGRRAGSQAQQITSVIGDRVIRTPKDESLPLLSARARCAVARAKTSPDGSVIELVVTMSFDLER